MRTKTFLVISIYEFLPKIVQTCPSLSRRDRTSLDPHNNNNRDSKNENCIFSFDITKIPYLFFLSLRFVTKKLWYF